MHKLYKEVLEISSLQNLCTGQVEQILMCQPLFETVALNIFGVSVFLEFVQ